MARSDFLKRLLLGFGLVNLLTALIVVTPLFQSYRLLQQKASTEASGLVQLMERTVAGVITQVDIVLQTCTEEIEQQLAKGGERRAIDALVQRQYKHLPELNVLRVTDATGQVISGVGPLIGNGINVADRDYFIQARDNLWPALFVSPPLAARTTSEPAVFLARRISRSAGAFDGIVYTAIPIARFQSLFQSLYLGPNGSIGLFGLNRSLIARQPEVGPQDVKQALIRRPCSTKLSKAVQMTAFFP